MTHCQHPQDRFIKAWLSGHRIQEYLNGKWVALPLLDTGIEMPEFKWKGKYRIAEYEYQYLFVTGDGFYAITPQRYKDSEVDKLMAQYPNKLLQKFELSKTESKK